jgi:hypothetical protein
LYYCVVAGFYIICCDSAGDESESESVVSRSDTIERIGDAGILETEIDMVPIGDFNDR